MEFDILFQRKQGLEVGGPSTIFMDIGALPVYPAISELDGCNFSENSLWEQGLKEGLTYKWGKDKIGYQYICEGTAVSGRIQAEKYDFVISSNCVEHIANPLKAVEDWLKIIKKNGLLLIIAPKKEGNFDHNRKVDTFSHLERDFNGGVEEDDLSHLEEIIENHDLTMDLPAGSLEQFRERSLENYSNRALHQHVFDSDTLTQVFEYFKCQVIFRGKTEHDYVVLGRKT